MHPERASFVLSRSALTAPELQEPLPFPTLAALAVLFDPALASGCKQVVCDLLSPPAGLLLYSCCFVFFVDLAPTFLKNLFWDARPLGSGLGQLAACTAGSPDKKLEETRTGTSRWMKRSGRCDGTWAGQSGATLLRCSLDCVGKRSSASTFLRSRRTSSPPVQP